MLTHEVHKPLYNGQEILSRRSYAIRIVPEGTGYRVDGALAGVEVIVPPALEPLAALERARPDDGLFPLWLDANGMIVKESSPRDSGTIGKAGEIVSVWLGRSPLNDSERQAASNFVSRLKAYGPAAGGSFPGDLFHPVTGKREESQTVELPGGNKGKITVEIDAIVTADRGMQSRIERRVTTDLGGDQRMTREVWELERTGN